MGSLSAIVCLFNCFMGEETMSEDSMSNGAGKHPIAGPLGLVQSASDQAPTRQAFGF